MFSVLTAIRDLLAHWLPLKMANIILPKGDYVFLVHPLSFRDAVKKYSFARFFSEKIIRFWSTHYWPIIGAPISGLKSEEGAPLKGYVIIVPLTPEQMFRDVALARCKILQGVKLAEKMGATLIGLGGFNSILTHDGQDLIGKAEIGITTGNTLSAYAAIENLHNISNMMDVNLRKSVLAIVGSAGSVGSACAKILADNVEKLIIIDVDKSKNEKLYSKLAGKGSSAEIEMDHSLEGLKKCDFILTSTSSVVPIVKSEHLKSGAIVVDACQPKNVAPDVMEKRDDVLVIDSGIFETDNINCKMDLGPFANEVYACLGEILILARNKDSRNFSIGKVDPQHVNLLSEYAKRSNIKLAKFRNEKGYITQAQLDSIKQIVLNRENN